MSSAGEQQVRRIKPSVPPEIHASLVDSLFQERRTLLVGSLAASFAVVLTALKTHELLLWVIAGVIILFAAARNWDMGRYAKLRAAGLSTAAVVAWERRYVFGASVFDALLGVWCFIAFVRTDDAFVQLISLCMTIAYMVGTSGRNFGSSRLVIAQILCAGVPSIAAVLLVGNFYYGALALVLLLPFFTSLKFISDRLRRTLLDAVIAQRDMSLLAKRFDTALNNMPSGLCMFDADRTLVVSNDKFGQLFEINLAGERKGATVREIVRDCVDAGTIMRSEAEGFALEFEKRLSGEDRTFMFETPKARSLNFTFQAMESGGSVVLVEDVTERKAAEARIKHLARYDALTDLPNRNFLREQMDQALAGLDRGRGPVAVLFIDLDQFKQVNDTLGHPRGDTLLREVAERLRSNVREGDLVSRFGGDEFVIVQSPVSGVEEAATMSRRLIEALSETYEVDGHRVVIGASIGIAMAPRDGIDADLLLKNADMALYWAKAERRGSWRFFEAEMDIRAQARRTLELDLRGALAGGAFQVYYQPLFDLRSKKISTCEALLRWPHPVRGMISPAEFIPVAEEMGLIVEIGNWVLQQACRDCSRWPSDVRVAVNISANQFRRGNLVNSVREALAASGLASSRLEIEITESVLFQDTRATRQALRQLRDLGVRLSLDDFGTGYSSLSYLHSLPLNKVKIDRSFLEGLAVGDRSLVLLRGIARLSAQLGLSVAIEGIETGEQLALVSAEDTVQEVQGFLFSPAIPYREISRLLLAVPTKLEKVA
jgi:diguanylate cyclase (GGDEF)-like protein